MKTREKARTIEAQAIASIREEQPYTYELRENEVILNPNSIWEHNITEEEEECSYCADKHICTREKGSYCEEFIIEKEYVLKL
ncbi:MAG: hypothetical protein AMQ74_01861 [Candidatus Methanofastidiosum methylothiophilum]|uniref:Uncharacterized protein n=1 Tax=Candidatus Methanofastidiosum methylothiophilum TaxID=1705564 RepID=A0A150IMG6_9EURY|nr:MAG: hypothetical protein AMQ74_01861 [Candidatus Methanofastidiosum methylthiophilus]